MSKSNSADSLDVGGSLDSDRMTSLSSTSIPNPEVAPKERRRRFSAAYKLRIVEEAARCSEPGEIGALLRREGLYSSQLSTWRKQNHAQGLQGLKDDKRGRKRTKHPAELELEKLRKKYDRVSRRLAHAETIIEIQKKVSAMLGTPLNSIENERKS